jgi:hypothetical protein
LHRRRTQRVEPLTWARLDDNHESLRPTVVHPLPQPGGILLDSSSRPARNRSLPFPAWPNHDPPPHSLSEPVASRPPGKGFRSLPTGDRSPPGAMRDSHSGAKRHVDTPSLPRQTCRLLIEPMLSKSSILKTGFPSAKGGHTLNASLGQFPVSGQVPSNVWTTAH